MASLGINSGPKYSNPFFKNNKSHLNLPPNSILPIFNNPKRSHQTLVCSSIASSNTAISENSHTKDVINSKDIDFWMQESVPDIVKNLKKAPLLIHIHSDTENRGFKLHTEKAIPKNWPFLQNDWKNNETETPDGLIFVEELDEDCGENLNEDGLTKAWGIVVQGKGVECGPSCYLLKTNRVCGGIGLGFCTHFCLMRVNNFRDCALKQFTDSWFLG